MWLWHEVPPLDEVASARLGSACCPDVAPSIRQRIVAQAQGNALALVELPLALSDQQRAGRATLPAVLPLSSRLRTLWSPLVAALPATSRDLILLAVLEGTGSLSLLRAAAAAAGQYDIDDLAAAEHAGLWTERAGLLACLDHVVETGQHARVIALPPDCPGCCATTAPGPRRSSGSPRPGTAPSAGPGAGPRYRWPAGRGARAGWPGSLRPGPRRRDAGREPAARQALATFQRLGAVEAAEVAAELETLTVR